MINGYYLQCYQRILVTVPACFLLVRNGVLVESYRIYLNLSRSWIQVSSVLHIPMNIYTRLVLGFKL